MALNTIYVGSFKNDAVNAKIIYDDVTMLAQTATYHNATDLPSYYEVRKYLDNSLVTSDTLAPQTDRTINIPPGQRPSVQECYVLMWYPAPV